MQLLTLSGSASHAEATSAEGEALADTEEAEAKLVLDALDARLVAFPSDEGAAVRATGAVPYYRLHEVVAAAITKKRVIVVSSGWSRDLWVRTAAPVAEPGTSSLRWPLSGLFLRSMQIFCRSYLES